MKAPCWERASELLFEDGRSEHVRLQGKSVVACHIGSVNPLYDRHKQLIVGISDKPIVRILVH